MTKGVIETVRREKLSLFYPVFSARYNNDNILARCAYWYVSGINIRRVTLYFMIGGKAHSPEGNAFLVL